MLYVIAAVAVAVLFAALVATLLSPRGGEAPPTPAATRAETGATPESREPGPWTPDGDEADGATIMANPPPASGEGVALSQSLQVHLASLEDDEISGAVPRLQVEASGRTDVGQRRSRNEDVILLDDEHGLYAVADGMGGYAAGEIAAQMAVDTVARTHEGRDLRGLDASLPRFGAELVASILEANDRIRAAGEADLRKEGMGTTLVACRFSRGRSRLYVAHVGDSRCYRLRDGVLERLTTDHTLAELGIRGPGAHKLSRALGVFDEVDVELNVDEPQPDDRYLLCSDGLTKMVEDRAIAEHLGREVAVQDVVEGLVDEANARGGRDNISVIVIGLRAPTFLAAESGEHPLGPSEL
jgi:serine/threonine protein phosphatase PrpC